jgi:hypothetical protein
VVPQTHVDSHVFADRTNGARAAGPPRCCASLQAAGDEVFLDLCCDDSYVELQRLDLLKAERSRLFVRITKRIDIPGWY